MRTAAAETMSGARQCRSAPAFGFTMRIALVPISVYGHSALLATPRDWHSAASAYAATDMAHLDIAYSALVSLNDGMISPFSGSNMPWFSGGESVRMCGLRCACADANRCGSAKREVSHVPRALIPFTRSYTFGFASSVGPRLIADACVSDETHVVDDNVQRAKVRRHTADDVLNGPGIAHVKLDCERLGARIAALRDVVQLVDDGVDCAGERLMGLGALGRHCNIRAARDERLGDLSADTTRGARAV